MNGARQTGRRLKVEEHGKLTHANWFEALGFLEETVEQAEFCQGHLLPSVLLQCGDGFLTQWLYELGVGAEVQHSLAEEIGGRMDGLRRGSEVSAGAFPSPWSPRSSITYRELQGNLDVRLLVVPSLRRVSKPLNRIVRDFRLPLLPLCSLDLSVPLVKDRL